MINLFRNFTYNFQFNFKLKKKLIISFLILAILPTLFLFILLYYQFSNIILSNTLHSEESLSLQTKEKLENTLGQINESIDFIANNSFIKNLYLYENEMNLSQLEREDVLNFIDEVKQVMSETSQINHVKIYMDEPFEKLLSDHEFSSQNIFMPMIDIKVSYWHGIFSSRNISQLVCPSLYLTPSERDDFGQFAIVYKVPYSNSYNPAMYIVAYFSMDTIYSILEENIQFSNSVTYLIDNRDTLVSSTDSVLVGRYLLKYKDVPEHLNQTSTFSSKAYGFDKVFMSYNKIQGTNWYMISSIPEKTILLEGRIALLKILLIYIFVIIIIMYLAFWLSKTIVKRIQSVINQMNLVKAATPTRLEVYQGEDEIGDLIDTYNYMVNKINKLLQEQEKSAREVRKSEFKALQSQINPHFLYNTLDMIRWLSNKEDHEKVSTAIQSLSKFYKLTLNKGNITVSLKEELEHVSLYVTLQNMRYEDNINFIIDAPDELLDYKVPKLILQPIVENSIQHGIFGKESKKGSIIIMCWIEEDMVVLTISDDGVGMPMDKVKNILKGKGESSSGNNIAIYNTHRRLQLFYNQEYGLTYRSEENVGTEVEIKIPAQGCIKSRKIQ